MQTSDIPNLMNIFIKDKLLRIIAAEKQSQLKKLSFDLQLNAQVDYIRFEALTGDTLIMGADVTLIDRFLIHILSEKERNYVSITFVTDNKKAAKKCLFSHFKRINAGGGVVYNKKGKILVMKRFGKWDLPKGKADKGEKFRETAAREVTEECNIKVAIGKKVCTTWHTYRLQGKRMLKCTKWYKMDCLDDRQMTPQIEEDIEELRWMKKAEVAEAMSNSYESIRFVMRKAKVI